MDWIKRNLFFLIGGVVALALMGLAGFYLYSKWSLNGEVIEKLNAQYAELKRLSSENPHPGYGKTDNIQIAKEQQQQLRALQKKTREQFNSIPAIPASDKVTSEEFSSSLRRTIDQLQRVATNSSVILPQAYSFSFEAQKPRMTFAAGSLEPLSRQLGEVKAICDILFAAKVNSLDNLRRERVSPDDSSGPVTDYLEKKSVTNELAILSPYEVTFRCFSAELASVLSGFGASSCGIVVKSLNVDPAPASAEPDPSGQPGPVTTFFPVQGATGFAPRGEGAGRGGMDNAMASRYGIRPGAGRGMGGPGGPGGGVGVQLRGPVAPPPPQAYTPQPGVNAAPGAVAPGKGGLQTVLDEKQLKVTVYLDVVKLLPPKKGEAPAPAAAPAPAPTPAP